MQRTDSFEKPAVLLLALALDLGAGEPPTRVHPVVGIGKLLELSVRQAPSGPRGGLLYGAACAAAVTLIPAWVTRSLLAIVRPWALRLVVGAWLLKTCFAYQALEEAALLVAGPLSAQNLTEAREALGALVSRDRAGLDDSQISASTIESLAENLGDGFVAPLLSYALGGLPAAVLYRAANTADSMIGYRGRYEYLGKAAARLDDTLNALPARLTAFLILTVSGANAGRAWRTLLRDHDKTSSPNAGWPMSAAAGSLGVSLQKPGAYHLNEDAREPDVDDIYRAIQLCRRAAVLCVAITLLMTVLGRRNS